MRRQRSIDCDQPQILAGALGQQKAVERIAGRRFGRDKLYGMIWLHRQEPRSKRDDKFRQSLRESVSLSFPSLTLMAISQRLAVLT